MGAISALGRNTAEFAQALAEGRSGIAPIESTSTVQMRFQNGAEVKGYCHTPYFEDRRADFMDRFAQFAVIAAREAVADAGVQFTPELRETAAIVTGSCVGGQSTEDIGFQEVYKHARNRVHPLTIPKTMANAGASHISMEFGITGPSFTISTACSSAAHAIGQAYWMLRSGVTDLAITGGSEAPFSFGILKAWEAMRVVSPDTCRPFSKDRHGMILGEGAAMLVLEPLEAARARGARIHAEIVGFGMSADAGHITQPSAEGAARAAAAGAWAPGPGASTSRRLARARTNRVHQCARHRDGGQRPHRDSRHPRRFRRPCRPPGDQLHQVDARPRAGRLRGARVRRHRAGVARRPAATHREL